MTCRGKIMSLEVAQSPVLSYFRRGSQNMGNIAPLPSSLGFGKRVLDDWYIHRTSVEFLSADAQGIVSSALTAAPNSALERANVLKLSLSCGARRMLRVQGQKP